MQPLFTSCILGFKLLLMKKHLYTGLLFTILLVSNILHADDPKSPLLDAYYAKIRLFMKSSNMDSARQYAKLALRYAREENREKDIARSLLYLAQNSYTISPREGLYLYLGARNAGISCGEKAVIFRASLTIGAIYRREAKFDSTKYHYNECIKIANDLLLAERSQENLRRLGMVYNNYGAFYVDIGEMSKGAGYLIETEKIGRELKDTGMMLRAAINIGAIYSELGSPENKLSKGYTAKIFLQKAKAYYLLCQSLIKPEDEKNKPHVLNNIGVVYTNLLQYDSAQFYLKQALELYIKNKNYASECSCNYTLGSAIYKAGRPDEANVHFQKAVDIGSKYDYKMCLISALSNQGQYYTQKNMLNEAEQVLKKALELKSSLKNYKENYLLYEKLYLLYEKKQEFRNAFNFYKKYVYARDSIADIEHLNLIEDIELKYETEKKDEKISELNLEKLILIEKSRTREAQIRLRNLLIVGILLFVLMGAVILWFWYQKNQLITTQKAADLEHRLLRARMNPHFLFNGLNTIQKHYEDGDIQNASLFMSDFSTFLRMILNKTGETKHSLSDEIDFTKLYVSLEQRKYPDRITFVTEIPDHIETEQWLVPSLILQPIVENAIWHGILPTGNNGTIKLQVQEINDSLVISISDNGVGYKNSMMKKNGTHVSKALEMIKQRLGKNGSIELIDLEKDEQGQGGTTVKLTINEHI